MSDSDERRQPPGPPAALMAIVPHPDDEAFGLGGTLLRARAAGLRTVLVTLTRGRGGRTLGLCLPERLGDLREAELRDAAAVFGVARLEVRDHHDYVPDGDRGIPRHDGLAAADPDRIRDDLSALIAEERPEAVVTFGPHGSNGHPDHVAAHHLTHAALAVSGHLPRAIYHYASTRPYDGPEREGFLEPEVIRSLHRDPSHRLRLSPVEIARKMTGIGAHRSQALSIATFLRNFAWRLTEETFVQVDLHGEPVASGGALRDVDRL